MTAIEGKEAAQSWPVVGEELPVRSMPLTRQRLVMEAGANRDFAPIHHDSEAARAAGAPDMFTNFVFLQSAVEFTIRAWAGSSAKIAQIALRLRGFNVAGATFSCGGTVESVTRADETLTVVLSMWTRSEHRVTSSGRCVVTLPA